MCLVHDVLSVIPAFFVIIVIIDILDRDKTFYSMDIRGHALEDCRLQQLQMKRYNCMQ